MFRFYISFLTIGIVLSVMNQSNREEDVVSLPGRPRRNVVVRELEGARLEKLRSLRLSRAGYLGAMNRSQRLIEQLLLDPANYEVVAAERISANKIFDDYTKCCQDFRASLYENETAKFEEMLEENSSVSRNREELEGQVEEWLQEVQRKLIDDAEQAKLDAALK